MGRKYLEAFLKNLRFKIFIVALVIVFSASAKNAFCATYYMPDDFSSLQEAFSRIISGDTLIIRSGIYTGSSNDITHSQKPPNGREGAYTNIVAEYDGEVVFSGTTCLFSDVSYLNFQGVLWEGDNTNTIVAIGSATHSHHLKFLRCGVFSEGSISAAGRNDGFVVTSAHHVLFEGCYAFGNMRYAFYAGRYADSIIFRRCVSRIDAYNTQTGIASFMIYDSQNIEIQNCISIDIDSSPNYYLANGSETVPNSFYTRSTGEGYSLNNVNIRGCIALNISSGQFLIGGGGNDFSFLNCVFWDGYNGIRSRYGGGSWNHCLSGQISSTTSSSHGYYTEQANEPITNSIAYGVTTNGINSLGPYSLSDYNCFFNNGNNFSSATPGTNSFCTENSNAIDAIDGDPGNGTAALKYLVRIEDASDLDGAASDSGDIGPTILNQIGVSGTLWGEDGYDTLTNISLWPFPNEDVIQEHMRSYSYDEENIRGARGFCAYGKQINGTDDITLTSYIWEYLGSPMPTFSNTIAAPQNLRIVP